MQPQNVVTSPQTAISPPMVPEEVNMKSGKKWKLKQEDSTKKPVGELYAQTISEVASLSYIPEMPSVSCNETKLSSYSRDLVDETINRVASESVVLSSPQLENIPPAGQSKTPSLTELASVSMMSDQPPVCFLKKKKIKKKKNQEAGDKSIQEIKETSKEKRRELKEAKRKADRKL